MKQVYVCVRARARKSTVAPAASLEVSTHSLHAVRPAAETSGQN